MNAHRVLGLIGRLLVVCGLVVGFVPLSSEGASCGSVFTRSGDAYVTASCESLGTLVMIPAVVLPVIGALLAGAAALLKDEKAFAVHARQAAQHSAHVDRV
jgi:hypothetical protein